MWKRCAAYTFLVLSCVVAAAKPTPSADPMVSEGQGPTFRCQIAQRLGMEPDSLHLVVAVSVANDLLSFLRVDSGFSASFDLETTILNSKDGLVTERIHTVDVFSKTFAETNSRTRHSVRTDEFLLAAGDYNVHVAMTDKESRKKSKWEGKITLAQSDSLLRLSDIYWVSQDSALSDLKVPRVVGSFSTSDKEAKAHVQLFSRASGEIHLRWAVLNQKRDTLQSFTDMVHPDGQIQTEEFAVKLDGLSADQYRLVVEAEGNGRREVKERSFATFIPGIPGFITNLDQAIKELKYIATSEETNRFRQATPADREQLFKDFWKRRDPTSGTEENELMEEYFLRVKYANEKFSTNREGWETDRGRIYILYGEPTDIERHPFDPGSRPYEIWFYSNLARRFAFVDYTGFGDYQLAGPEFGY